MLLNISIIYLDFIQVGCIIPQRSVKYATDFYDDGIR